MGWKLSYWKRTSSWEATRETSAHKRRVTSKGDSPTNSKMPGRETRAARRAATGSATKQNQISSEGYDVAGPERSCGKRVKSLESISPQNVKTPGRETRASRQAATGPATEQNGNAGFCRSEGVEIFESKAPTNPRTPGRETRAARRAATGPPTMPDGSAGFCTSKRVKSFEGNAPTNSKTPGGETRAARRAATGSATKQNQRSSEGYDVAGPERSCGKRVKSLESISPQNVKTPGRETRASRQAATGPHKIQGKTSGYNAGALTLQTVATRSKGTKRRIEAASCVQDVKRIKVTQLASKANGGTRGRRARKDRKDRPRKQVLIEDRASAPAVALTSVFDKSSESDDGDESESAFRVSMDSDLWTQEQEMALQNAYATIKPSASFWHLISKRVPGRSAEECFNKFYSAHPTPPRVPRRSGLKEVDCPPSLPKLTKAKVTGGKRLLEAHRTVRNILRKQQLDDEDYKADAFAALEPPDVVHSVFSMSKETEVEFCVNNCSLPRSMETSTAQYPQADKENWKPTPVGQSRELGIGQSDVFSPEILKKVKDPLSLDKYIDHLHQRRSRRTGTKSSQRKDSAQRARGVCDLFKDGLDFREVRLDAIHRAKQELRDVFLRPSSAVDDPIFNLLDESSDGIGTDDEEDDVPLHSQTVS